MNSDRVSAEQAIFTIECCTEFIGHFLDNQPLYRKELSEKTFNAIKSLIPKVSMESLSIAMHIKDGYENNKHMTIKTVNTLYLYYIYRFADFYLNGVKDGVIKDKDNLISGENLKFIETISKTADDLQKELNEELKKKVEI